jgi:hypothetical protein
MPIEKISLIPRDDELPLPEPPESDGPEWQMNPRPAGSVFKERQIKKFCGNLATVWSTPDYMERSGKKASVVENGEQLNGGSGFVARGVWGDGGGTTEEAT